jgi:UPF0755 protein
MKRIVGVLLGGLLLSGGLLWQSWQHPIGASTGEIQVQIKRGSSFQQVMRQLEAQDLLSQPLFFQGLAYVTGQQSRIQAGTFLVNPAWNHATLLDHLVSGQALLTRLTFPEGLTFGQITERLQTAGLGQRDAYQQLFRDSELRELSGISGLATLEGVLFPETYFFSPQYTEREILAQMIREFRRRFTQIRASATEKGVSLEDHEVVVLASIIEKETALESDRDKISGVFHNRLRIGMKLQSDPTVIYGIPNFDGNLTRKHLTTSTPFNTYTEPGLPPTPISNPGEAALRSALQPANVNYLYFVAKGDGSSAFSRTLQEHNRAVYQYQIRPHRTSSSR